jgi:Flp pilus assembly protein TadB
MLSREDSRRLAELERQLRRDDPEFCDRMSGGGRDPAPRRRHSLSLIFTAVVIWLAAITLGVLGWWPAAILAALCGTAVIATLVYRRARRRRGTS